MVTGAKPFQGEDIPELMFKVANLPATPPSHLAPDVAPVIDFIVARAMKKRAQERYASAADMAKDLRDAAKEVEVAEKAGAARMESSTIPNAPVAPAARTSTPGIPRDEPLELRPSPRFDSVDALARLSILPKRSDDSASRAGWTVNVKREPPQDGCRTPRGRHRIRPRDCRRDGRHPVVIMHRGTDP